MDNPTIIINGKPIEMPRPKARVWREIISFNEARRNLPTEDFINEHAKIIALAFRVSEDDILDNLDVDEILPTYFNVFTCVVSLLTANLSVSKKNSDEEVITQV